MRIRSTLAMLALAVSAALAASPSFARDCWHSERAERQADGAADASVENRMAAHHDQREANRDLAQGNVVGAIVEHQEARQEAQQARRDERAADRDAQVAAANGCD